MYNYVSKKMFELAKRKNIDLNDPEVQRQFSARIDYIMQSAQNLIEQLTTDCNCGAKSAKNLTEQTAKNETA